MFTLSECLPVWSQYTCKKKYNKYDLTAAHKYSSVSGRTFTERKNSRGFSSTKRIRLGARDLLISNLVSSVCIQESLFFLNFLLKNLGLEGTKDSSSSMWARDHFSIGVWNFSKPGHDENSSCEAGLVNKMLQ
jgi:hypothetical protein